LLGILEYRFVVALDDKLVFFGVFRLLEDRLGMSDSRHNFMLGPQIETLFKQTIRWEEDQHATWCDLCNSEDGLAQVYVHRTAFSVLEAEVEALIVWALLEDADQHLV